MKILIVSSLPPTWCSNLGLNLVKLLNSEGHEVDFLSKNETDNPEPWMHFVYGKPEAADCYDASEKPKLPPAKPNRLRSSICDLKARIRKILIDITDKYEIPPLFSVDDERQPPVPLDDLKRSLPNKQYDRIYTLFWWGMISVMSLKLLHDMYHCEVIVMNMDMSAMTGGCHYFGDCRKFEKQCKSCPQTRFTKAHTVPHINYLIKKEVFANEDFKFILNAWMRRYFLDSGLFKPSQLICRPLYVNPQIFKPVNVAEKKRELGIPEDKFVFFSGATFLYEVRKGFKYLEEAFRLFANEHAIASNCLLLLAGEGEGPEIAIETRRLGRIDMSLLAQIYAVSDAFLSPSVDDAGPSMVNQALMCGTPVVAFDIGVAIECVKTGETGYLAKKKDSKDFCNGMKFVYSYPQKDKMRSNCRNIALKQFGNDDVWIL